MFPKNGSKYPEIRFKDFTDAWEQRKLGKVFIGLQNNTLSRAELNTENGDVLNVHYGDILVKFGEIISIKKEELPAITNPSILEKYKSSMLQNGDIIIADTAEDSTVGKCSEIVDCGDKKVLSGLHTIPLRPKEKFGRGYLGYYINSGSYHNQLLPLMQGIKVTSISKSALQDTVIEYPNNRLEQKQIGDFLANLDNLITLHQRKLEKLENFKKSCLEKMFV
jgi:type I restriction enzyme S subunit